MFACLFVTQSRPVITEMILLHFGYEIITASIDKIIRLNILDATDHVKELIQFNQYVFDIKSSFIFVDIIRYNISAVQRLSIKSE